MLGGIALDKLDENGDQRLSVDEWATCRTPLGEPGSGPMKTWSFWLD